MPDIVDHIKNQLSYSRSLICDDKDSLSYHECKKLIVDNEENRKTSFDALVVKNKLPAALQIVSHLVNQQSFLILNGSLKFINSEENIPIFCQNVITFKEFDKLKSNRTSSFTTISKNSFFLSKNSSFDSKKSYLILKTSGTTNQPKFVLHDQKLVLRNAKRSAEKLGLKSEDRVLIPVPIHHSYGLVTAFIPSLITGCSIKLINNTNAISLIEAIKSFKPTVLFATPGLVEMLLMVKTTRQVSKVTVTAGDKIREDLFLKYEKQIGTLLILYGSTEMGAMAISDVNKEVSHRAKGGLIAIPGVKFKVTNYDDNLGAILCKNDCGSTQYLDYQGERIVTNSTLHKWFDTKDMGKLDEKEIKVLGRSDHKINRNGGLLSYFEIENAIELACNELKKVIVVKLASENIVGTQFAAVCELKEDNNIDPNHIRKKCLEKLGRNMMPDTVEIIKTMPLLPNGKIDRNFLQKRFHNLGC